jgi:poly-beta-1,6-N-acetyl-D-glucosamine synthase
MTGLLHLLFSLSVLGLIILVIYPFFSYFSLSYHRNKNKPALNFKAPVSIIIACYNEEKFIRVRIEYFLNANEWIEGSELIIISTGSTDKTDQILMEYHNDPRIKAIMTTEKISKIKALNAYHEICRHDIIIFSDCRQTISKGAVKNLIRHFANPEIATVTSSLHDTKNRTKVSFFRNVFNKTAVRESAAGSCLNVYGALYAQRKTAFRSFPEDLLFDDLFVVISTLQQKKRLIQVQDKDAIIHDIEFEKYYRKERIERLVRGLLIFYHSQKKQIHSLPSKMILRFLIYKYLKLFMPFFLLNILIIIPFLLLKLDPVILGTVSTLIIVLFSIPKTRNFLSLFISINYHFLIAVLKFFFKNEKSNQWKALDTTFTKTESVLK